MGKKKGRDLAFLWEDTKVGNVTSISLSVDGETIDVSDWDSGDWNEYIAGRKDWTMDIGLYHNSEDESSQQSAMELAMISGDRSGAAGFGPETPAEGDVTYTGGTILSNFTIDAGGADDPIESSFTLQGSGALTRNVEAAA